MLKEIFVIVDLDENIIYEGRTTKTRSYYTQQEAQRALNIIISQNPDKPYYRGKLFVQRFVSER